MFRFVCIFFVLFSFSAFAAEDSESRYLRQAGKAITLADAEYYLRKALIAGEPGSRTKYLDFAINQQRFMRDRRLNVYEYLELYRKDAFTPKGAVNMGLMCQHGLHDVSQKPNYELARKWFERALTMGSKSALGLMGMLYYKGWGVEKDLHQARFFWEEGARKGGARTMANLATLIENNCTEPASAVYWYQKAKASGDSETVKFADESLKPYAVMESEDFLVAGRFDIGSGIDQIQFADVNEVLKYCLQEAGRISGTKPCAICNHALKSNRSIVTSVAHMLSHLRADKAGKGSLSTHFFCPGCIEAYLKSPDKKWCPLASTYLKCPDRLDQFIGVYFKEPRPLD